MNKENKKKVDVVVGLSRLAGGTLIIVGSLIVYFFAQAAFDPNAVIEINGTPTRDQNAKIGALIFICLFPVLGMFLAFTPDKFMDKWVAKVIARLG
ncbi:hypothetical protein FE810_13095 [Thalassotalea litorea]|uniref:Uncharacterized protein n=1 Tax=Thalassotalea litorea TaxID=2020715 RepID=A0A5R9IIJ6_9GAMM|nr:hypothetical protein [Thalassotalea litorea]TLU61988.1 hypothetical protein FE810_13095 [Thalassotalea litorea]